MLNFPPHCITILLQYHDARHLKTQPDNVCCLVCPPAVTCSFSQVLYIVKSFFNCPNVLPRQYKLTLLRVGNRSLLPQIIRHDSTQQITLNNLTLRNDYIKMAAGCHTNEHSFELVPRNIKGQKCNTSDGMSATTSYVLALLIYICTEIHTHTHTHTHAHTHTHTHTVLQI